MDKRVMVDYNSTLDFIREFEIELMEDIAKNAKKHLINKTGAGSEFTGWVDLPINYDKEEFNRVLKAAEKIKENSEVFIVIGIGGSYLGARAAIEFLRHGFYNNISRDERKHLNIFCG